MIFDRLLNQYGFCPYWNVDCNKLVNSGFSLIQFFLSGSRNHHLINVIIFQNNFTKIFENITKVNPN